MGAAIALAPARPAFADGPAPCSVGGPPFPFAGFCATYSGANTWYGSYGPGFPTDEGWGFCADPPASGGDYPAPVYDYEPSSAPDGANTGQAGALGFAFSEAQALGWWGGSPGQFTSDQAAVAGKLLYDAVVWDSPVPAMDPGVLAAYQALDGWYRPGGRLDGRPAVHLAARRGRHQLHRSQATYQVKAELPRHGNAVTGLPGRALDLRRHARLGSSGPTSRRRPPTVRQRRRPDLRLGPRSRCRSRCTVAGRSRPRRARLLRADRVRADRPEPGGVLGAVELQPPSSSPSLPTTGTVSIVKEGDDPAYYPLGGALFDV